MNILLPALLSLALIPRAVAGPAGARLNSNGSRAALMLKALGPSKVAALNSDALNTLLIGLDDPDIAPALNNLGEYLPKETIAGPETGESLSPWQESLVEAVIVRALQRAEKESNDEARLLKRQYEGALATGRGLPIPRFYLAASRMARQHGLLLDGESKAMLSEIESEMSSQLDKSARKELNASPLDAQAAYYEIFSRDVPQAAPRALTPDYQPEFNLEAAAQADLLTSPPLDLLLKVMKDTARMARTASKFKTQFWLQVHQGFEMLEAGMADDLAYIAAHPYGPWAEVRIASLRAQTHSYNQLVLQLSAAYLPASPQTHAGPESPERDILAAIDNAHYASLQVGPNAPFWGDAVRAKTFAQTRYWDDKESSAPGAVRHYAGLLTWAKSNPDPNHLSAVKTLVKDGVTDGEQRVQPSAQELRVFAQQAALTAYKSAAYRFVAGIVAAAGAIAAFFAGLGLLWMVAAAATLIAGRAAYGSLSLAQRMERTAAAASAIEAELA